MSAANQLALSARVSTRRISARVASRTARPAPGFVALAGACAILTSAAGSLAIGAPLSGSASLASGASAGLTVGKALAGTAAVTSGATATATVAKPLAGTAAVTTGASATLGFIKNLAGTSAATTAASATLSIARNLVGSSSIVTGAIATLSIAGQVSLAGTSAILTGASATATVTKALAGTSAATTGAAATLTLTYNLAGTAAITSGASGDTVAITHNLAGTSAVATAASATLSIAGQVSLAGTSAIVTGASATATVTKALAGTSAIATGATATLSVSAGGSAPTFIRKVAATAQQAADSISLSGLVVDGTNKLVVVELNSYKSGGSTGATAVTVGGVSATRFGSVIASSTGEAAEVWYAIAPADGTVGVSATLPAGTAASAMVATLYNGAHQTTPLAAFTSNTTTGATSLTINVSSTTSDLVAGSLHYYDANTYTAGAGQTEPTNFASHQVGYESVRTSYKAGASSSTAFSYTTSASAEMTLLGYAIKPV